MNEKFLVTSNMNKLKEFKRFGLSGINIEKGVDLDEVDSDSETVILYKSISAGPNRIVEDTSLHVDGEDVGANIRWLLDNLNQFDGKSAVWEVYLGFNDGLTVSTFKGSIKGAIIATDNKVENSFGFDQYFVPEGQTKTLYELELAGQKDLYSARKLAVENMISNRIISKHVISEVPKWEGSMQH